MTSTNYKNGKGLAANPQSSALNMPSLGSYNSTAWNNSATGGSSIWNSAPIGSGKRSGDAARTTPRNGDMRGAELESLSEAREIGGSSMLLEHSETDGWGRRNSAQWPAMPNSNAFSKGLQGPRNERGTKSPAGPSTNQHTRSNSPYSQFSAIGAGPGKASQGQSHLDPTSRTFNASGIFDNSHKSAGSSMHPSGTDDMSRNLNSIHFGNMHANGAGNSGYASSAASRSGSLPPSRHGNESGAPQFGDFAANPFHQSKSDFFTHRPAQPSHSSNLSMSGANRMNSSGWNISNDLSSGFSRMDLNKDVADGYSNNWDQSYQLASNGNNGASNGLGFSRSGSVSFDQDTQMPPYLQQQYNHYRYSSTDPSSQSPNGSDTRRGYDSPLFQHATPSHQGPDHQRAHSTASSRSNFNPPSYTNPAVLERKLKSLQQEQYASLQQNPAAANAAMAFRQSGQNFFPYGGAMTPQAIARMNVNQPYLPQNMPAMTAFQLNGMNTGHRVPPRGPAIDNAAGESLRSALMEEFRSSKGNRKYELKDIYNHVVEFSGDQHGSRFIQQKLETANSDEKAQLFSEIFPNAWQLMTDVFGNYVVQKFFEHGNQTQKQQLANKMKGHIAELSVQMYGCRVVQKAFEHVLNDQQAALVKELEPSIIQTIKDQNGNHVVQKAIQRIPAENIEFITRAVKGKVNELASHSYGCRVIQRMLETFVGQQTQYEVIDELHENALGLIVDQYGNYVIQNVMDHGREEDRLRLIEITIGNVLTYSRHKYASNVVEHCLRDGREEHRRRIVDVVRSTDEKGEPRMQQLVRDQYGNYVIQTIMKILKGDELRTFIGQVKEALVKVRQYSYGKHIGQIEKAVEDKTAELNATTRQQSSLDTSAATTPPPLVESGNSPQSASQPSTTNNSTVEGPVSGQEAKGGKADIPTIDVVHEDLSAQNNKSQ